MLVAFQFRTCIVMTLRWRYLSNREIFKLLYELSKKNSWNENTSNVDENFDINNETNFDENSHKISSSE